MPTSRELWEYNQVERLAYLPHGQGQPQRQLAYLAQFNQGHAPPTYEPPPQHAHIDPRLLYLPATQEDREQRRTTTQEDREQRRTTTREDREQYWTAQRRGPENDGQGL
jgi:hypothetical protein